MAGPLQDGNGCGTGRLRGGAADRFAGVVAADGLVEVFAVVIAEDFATLRAGVDFFGAIPVERRFREDEGRGEEEDEECCEDFHGWRGE